MIAPADGPIVLLDRRRIAAQGGTGVATFRTGLHRAVSATGARALYLDDAAGDPPNPRFAAWPAPRRMRVAVQGERVIVPDIFRRAHSRFSFDRQVVEITCLPTPDIAHWSHPVPIRVAGAVNVYTVHDVIPIEQPMLSGVPGSRLDALLRAHCAAGACFMTVSQTVRSALLTRYDLAAARVACAYQPVAAPATIGALPDGIVPGRYLLCLGRFEPRKNIARLIAAHRRADTGLPLLFVGPDGYWPSAAARLAVEREIDGQQVRRLGWQAAPTVAALIANARAVLMPSLAEGFGLPVIEAMRHGVPTLAAAHGAGGEIAGTAALRVDVLDEGASADAIGRVASDAAVRERLITLGLDHAARFSPELFVDRLHAFYQHLGRA